MSHPKTLPQSFINQKKDILAKLSVPLSSYTDRSPKGSVDIGIRDLIDEINDFEGCVTTSSCAGRVSVFLEGKRGGSGASLEDEDQEGDGEVRESSTTTAAKSASIGGKGAGGKWLYVSHDPLSVDILENRESAKELHELLGMKRDSDSGFQMQAGEKPGDVRWVRFKFEPMILHILTASLPQAQKILTAASQAGFRESGALNLTSAGGEAATTPMVAIRSLGLALQAFVGVYDEEKGEAKCIVDETQLGILLRVANERFGENKRRIERFRMLLREGAGEKRRVGEGGGEWEDKEVRRERKREEGLRRARELREVGEGRDGGLEEEEGPLDLELGAVLEDINQMKL
ncbi:hypothetical protein CJF32_00006428 [Rutstroemia sp. NJR-2017a WRK4]|nr:hypothetical protein CJF32_00006428 [Rutstroemia sp. NJR-2017a WRK4]